MADEQQQGPASAGPPPADRKLIGPAHAHRDGTCDDRCYEPTAPRCPRCLAVEKPSPAEQEIEGWPCYDPFHGGFAEPAAGPPPTPELDKQSVAIQNGAHQIVYFLDWLNEEGYVIARSPHEDDYDAEVLEPAAKSTQDLIAGYFQIDLNKIEAERRALLEYVRSLNS